MNRLLDLVLLPKKYYASLRNTRGILYPGVLLVGIIDVFFSFGNAYENFLKGRTGTVFTYNLLFIILCVIVIGFIDVYFLSKPISDLVKRFKNDDGEYVYGVTVEKVMKVYISMHFIMVPVNYLLSNILKIGNVYDDSSALQLLVDILPYWSCAIITRGICVNGKLNGFYKIITFIAIYVWSYMLSFVLVFGYKQLILIFFK